MNLFVLLLFYPSTLISIQQAFIESDIYYKAPTFNVKNANVTFGVPRPNRAGDGSTESFAETLTSICQAELINHKKAQISIDGIINLVFQDYYDPRSSGQEAMLALLSNNLFFKTNDTRVNQQYAVNLTGFFSGSNFGTNKINSLATNKYGLPFISSGDFGRPNADSRFSGFFPAEKITFAQILNTVEFNTFNAVLAILNHFNWTLVANLFQGNTYGYKRLQSVLDYSSQNASPVFTCGSLYGKDEAADRNGKSGIEYFCRCITSKQSINVIVLWMSTGEAYFAIKTIREKCSASKSWTFIISDDIQSAVNYSTDRSVLNNTLLLRNNGPWDFQTFIENCKETASPEAKETILSLINSFYSRIYKCLLEKEEGIPACPKSIEERFSLCSCTFNELSQDPYLSKSFYTADILSVYAEAISLIQNNCTFLNERRDKILSYDFPDFCSITEFGPLELSFAMKFVNFTGYTGTINFFENTLVRRVKSYYLYSVFNNSFDATLVGYINETGTTIYDDLITFVDGKVPVSEIVPQNPDLSYAVVDVFFGVSIVELVICLAMLACLIHRRENRVIRQCAPLVTIVMLIGVTGLALAQLFLSFARTDAWCTINLYIFRISLNLILMSLLVKNFRIYRIFANKKATAIVITESRLLSYIGAMTLFYIIILTVFVAALNYQAIVKQSASNPFYRYVQCVIPNKTWNTILQIVLDVILLIQIIASLILAWLTRKVRAEYRESQGLAAFSIIVFTALIIFGPLNYTLGDETDSQLLRYVILAEFSTVTILSSLALLFYPIFLAIYTRKKRDSEGAAYDSFIRNSYRYSSVNSNIE